VIRSGQGEPGGTDVYFQLYEGRSLGRLFVCSQHHCLVSFADKPDRKFSTCASFLFAAECPKLLADPIGGRITCSRLKPGNH
jgi:hypothetical protein